MFRFEGYTARYADATLTPDTIHLIAEITPEDGTYESATTFVQDFVPSMTDGLGRSVAFEKEVDLSNIVPYQRRDGTWYLKMDFSGLPAPKTMPPILSVTFTSTSGKQMMKPLYLP